MSDRPGPGLPAVARTHARSVVLVAVLVGIVLMSALGTNALEMGRIGGSDERRTYEFGTLLSLQSKATEEARRGVRVAMVELSWRQHEPSPGKFTQHYETHLKQEIATMRAAGRRVTLGLGLHDAPQWVHKLPNSHLVDHRGRTSADIDLTFNQQLRRHAETYLRRVAKIISLKDIYAVRITGGGDAEVLYPDDDGYWAFGVNAQNGPQMPPSMARNPIRGWKPGTAGPSPAAVRKWANWYVGALDNVVGWQISTLRSLGFRGWNEVLTTGRGVLPAEYEDAIKNRLPVGLTTTGAVWHVFYAQLPTKTKVVAYVTSMGDGSGFDDSCRASDRKVRLDDPVVANWSATRWVSRIADYHRLPKAGENPGYNLPPSLNSHYKDASGTGMMAAAIRQMQSCGFMGMNWAHDTQLWNGTSSFDRYADFVARVNGSAKSPEP